MPGPGRAPRPPGVMAPVPRARWPVIRGVRGRPRHPVSS
jgi:hypothetical protein